MEEEIKVGDIVQLKSGGPRMTVDTSCSFADGNVGFECSWFVLTNALTGTNGEHWDVDGPVVHAFRRHVLKKV